MCGSIPSSQVAWFGLELCQCAMLEVVRRRSVVVHVAFADDSWGLVGTKSVGVLVMNVVAVGRRQLAVLVGVEFAGTLNPVVAVL